MFGRQKIAALVAEFLGTAALTLLVLSVQHSQVGLTFFVAMAAGLVVALMSFAVGGISGGYFNPALTLGAWTLRKLDTLSGLLYIGAQFLGAWGAYYLYTYYVNTQLPAATGHFAGRTLVAEAVGTAVFGFVVAATLFQRNLSQGAKSAYVGLGLMVGIIAASSASIGLLNPALALGVRSVVWGTYMLGPVLGALVGMNLYMLLFAESGTTASVSAAVAPKRAAAKKRSSRK